MGGGLVTDSLRNHPPKSEALGSKQRSFHIERRLMGDGVQAGKADLGMAWVGTVRVPSGSPLGVLDHTHRDTHPPPEAGGSVGEWESGTR